MHSFPCRSCGSTDLVTFVDLGMSPLCQTQISAEHLNRGEVFYPLHAFTCRQCLLVQLDEFVQPDVIFNAEYPYFSSFSTSWVEHARRYSEMMRERFGLGAESLVVEVASNDGYLLQHFVDAGIPVLGIEPTANTAAAAVEKGVRTEVCFFGRETARAMAARYGKASVLLGNNVLAHVPDLNDFVGGIPLVLADAGVVTFEFPHLLELMQHNQFDTIYHEHFSYLSLRVVQAVFANHGLTVFDVEQLPTHGGSLRVFARHAADTTKAVQPAVDQVLACEAQHGLDHIDGYQGFSEQVYRTKRRLLEVLIGIRAAGGRVAGYGAPGKGNTLLNYCGIQTDFVEFTVDRNPAKKGTWTPGTRIPILDPEEIRTRQPDYLLVLPWNLKDEIIAQTAFIREWGGQWIIPVPEPVVLS